MPDQKEEPKPSPIFRKRTLSQNFGGANFQFSTPSSAGSFRTSSSSSKKSKKSNRVASVDMVEKVQTKDQIESQRPISPVRYHSPPVGGPKPLSSVFTVQQENGTGEQTDVAHLATDPANGLAQLSVSPRKPSLSFKNLALMQSRLKSEMDDSRVKLKALDFDKQSTRSNDQSEGESLASGAKVRSARRRTSVR